MNILCKLSASLIIAIMVYSGSAGFAFSQDIPADIPSPESHFGFTPGDDGMLFNYEEMIGYVKKLEEASPKIKLEQIGFSEMGKPMYLLFVSSEENISNLQQLKDINRQLALDHDISDSAQDKLVTEGKVFFFMTLSMHSTEVGPAQAAPLIIHELITSDDPEITDILNNTVYMITPSHNPDGMNMIVDNYNKYKGTMYEGSSMPGVYHKYVGHNINRDFVTLEVSENEAVSHVFSKEWFPQVMVEKHQMGSTGPRYYISPPSDPLSENLLPGLWNWKRIFGSRALTSMTDAGLSGVSVNYLFDMYWPGSTATSLWKGVIAMLSEAASVDIATPVYVEPNELSVSGMGLAEYEISINMPDPWSGGWWHLSDIVEYERINTLSYLHTASIHKEEILVFRNELTKKEVKRGKEEAPYYYIMPVIQHDKGELASLVNLLDKHGVNSYRLLKDQTINNRLFHEGDIVVPLSQPYRSFIKEVMESQKFPERHYSAGGEMIRPYDITTWSLPLHKGVESITIDKPYEISEGDLQLIETPLSFENEKPASFSGAMFPVTNNESFKAAFIAASMGLKVERLTEDVTIDSIKYTTGSFYIPLQSDLDDLLDSLLVHPSFVTFDPGDRTSELVVPRIGIIESWFRDMDAGWTRLLFDNHKIPFKVLRPSDLKDVNLSRNFDMVIFPDQSKSVLMEGKGGSAPNYTISKYPPEYAKGMEKEGLSNLLEFIDNGGKVISWGRSTDIFMGNLTIENDKSEKQEFSLPVKNIGTDIAKQGLDVTGSLLRVKLKPDHQLTLGMPEETGVFHRGSPVYTTSLPYFDMDRRVIATFAKDDILMSGFLENEELISEKAAMVWLKKGEGQIVLFSFCPQFRGSTPVTYKLLFNSLLMD